MKKQGFHLIELLLVISIIGILLAFALPSYSNHIAQERRLAAKLALLHFAGLMESYYAEHNSYEGASFAVLGASDRMAKYHLVIQTASAGAFEVAAIPEKEQAEFDLQCGTLSLDSRGTKKSSGPATLTQCWDP